MCAISDARKFLYRHPYATTEFDNPIEIIRDLVGEADRLAEENKKLRAAAIKKPKASHVAVW